MLGAPLGGHVEHFIVLMLENRSYDHMLGDLGSGYVGNPPGWTLPYRDGDTLREQPITVGEPPDVLSFDPPHLFAETRAQICGTPDVPNMAGFAKQFLAHTPRHDWFKRLPQYCTHYRKGTLPAIHTLAQKFGVFTHWFASFPGSTTPNRMFVHAGTSGGNTQQGAFYSRIAGQTIFDQLGQKENAWRVYFHDAPHLWLTGDVWVQTFKHHFRTIERFEADVQHDELTQYTFIEPRHLLPPWNSQHPGIVSRTSLGDALIARVYNALAANPAVFEKTLLLIVYDEHGGFADHVVPPGWEGWQDPSPWGGPAAPADYIVVPPDSRTEDFAFDRLGPRVPAVAISPWIPEGSVFGWGASNPAHRLTLEHTSVLATVKDLTGVETPWNRAKAAASLGAVLGPVARAPGNGPGNYPPQLSTDPSAAPPPTMPPAQVGVAREMIDSWQHHPVGHDAPDPVSLVRHFESLLA